jgi:DNA-binding transcriptional ArsR family regulator
MRPFTTRQDTVQRVTPEELVGMLAESDRLRIVAALVLGARTNAEIVQATGLDDRAVAKALRRLENGGLVTRGSDVLSLHEHMFKDVVRHSAKPAAVEDHGYADPKVESVVRTFIRDGHLTGMPAQQSRRRILLEHVVQSFEPGMRYPEREVDAVLRAWCADSHVDHATVRRYLVDYGLLTREHGVYWRSGGWLDVLEA